MKQRILALLLALTVAASICAVSAMAEDTAPESPAPSGEESAGRSEAGERPSEAGPLPAEDEAAAAPETEEESPSPAGPDPGDNALREPDALGSVSFANVESRMRENNFQFLVLQQSIDTIEDIDYEDLRDDLWRQLNSIAKTKWNLVLTGDTLSALGYMSEYEQDKTKDQLDQAYEAVRDQFDAIEDGEMQQDNADLIRQLKNLQDQILMAGESLYTALASMENQKIGLDRQLAALDRTVKEMELRYRLGQISALQLTQAKAGRASLASGISTLTMNIENYKRQLELLIGAEQTGKIALGAVPAVTAKQLEAMDVEADLKTAKELSYQLYDAKLTLEDAREDYMDEANSYGFKESRQGYRNAKRTWDAAQYTYNDTLQNYELKFRSLHAQVLDCKQILDTSQVSLESQKASYAASELKYKQGAVSQYALLEAKDELEKAEDAVRAAANELFATYNTYCWAVQHGILN